MQATQQQGREDFISLFTVIPTMPLLPLQHAPRADTNPQGSIVQGGLDTLRQMPPSTPGSATYH